MDLSTILSMLTTGSQGQGAAGKGSGGGGGGGLPSAKPGFFSGLFPKRAAPQAAAPFAPISSYNLMGPQAIASLGTMPQLLPPTAMSMPVGLDTAGLAKHAAQAFAPLSPLQLPPDAPDRPMPIFTDYSPFREKQAALAPIDPRDDEKTFRRESLHDGLAAAALAAAQGDDFGETLALAGGAFGQSAAQSREHRKEETFRYDESMRAFNSQMLQFDMQLADAQTAKANATSEIDFLRAQDDENRLIQNKELLRDTEVQNRGLAQQQLSFNLDLQKMNADVTNSANATKFQNEESARQWQNEEALRRMPQPEIVGNQIYTKQIGPDGKVTLTKTPMGYAGMLENLAELKTRLGPVAGAILDQQAAYSIVPQQDIKRTVLAHALGNDKFMYLFAPEQEAKDASFLPNPIDAVQNVFWPNALEHARKVAEKQVDAAVSRGEIPAEQTSAAMREIMAAQLEPYFTPEMQKKAQKLNDPMINAGLARLAGGK